MATRPSREDRPAAPGAALTPGPAAPLPSPGPFSGRPRWGAPLPRAGARPSSGTAGPDPCGGTAGPCGAGEAQQGLCWAGGAGLLAAPPACGRGAEGPAGTARQPRERSQGPETPLRAERGVGAA